MKSRYIVTLVLTVFFFVGLNIQVQAEERVKGACPSSSEAAVPFVKKYVENQLEKYGKVKQLSMIKVPGLTLPQINFFGRDLEESEKKNDFASFGLDDVAIGEGPFKAKTRLLVRPGHVEQLFVPILGLTFKLDNRIINYVCIDWDEEDLENSKINVFFLRTNFYKRVDIPRMDVIVEPYQGPVYLYTISGLISVIEEASFRIFKRPLLVSAIVKVVERLETIFYYFQTEFFRVGISEIEMTKDNIKIRGALGVLIKQFDILNVNRDLADKWWRKYLKNESIYKHKKKKEFVEPDMDSPHHYR